MYRLTEDEKGVTFVDHSIDAKGGFGVRYVPFEVETAELQQYRKWLEEGNTPEPYAPYVEVKEPTLEEKLAKVGITIEELKSVLS
jgi:hypothetical protein